MTNCTLQQALREQLELTIEDLPRTIDRLVAAARSAALEEAAKVAETMTESQRERALTNRGFLVPRCPIAAAIRALKTP